MQYFRLNHHYTNSAGKQIVILNRTRRYLMVLYRGTVKRYLSRTDWTRGTEYITDGTTGADYRAESTWYADTPAC